MDIERAQENVILQPGRQTPGLGTFMLVFTKVDTGAITLCLVDNEGDAEGPLLLRFDETGGTTALPLNSEVQLSEGDWHLQVYEQASTTNLNPSLATRFVWKEDVRVSNAAGAPDPSAYDPCDYCDEGEGCHYSGVVNIDGVQAATFGPFDPCVNNTLNINISYS